MNQFLGEKQSIGRANSLPSTMTACGVNSTPPPDYEPSLAFGQLVEMEGAAVGVLEMLGRLEVRLGKALRPAVPSAADGRPVDSHGPSPIQGQIGKVAQLLLRAYEEGCALTDRIAL
jgi:hypothetical protein